MARLLHSHAARLSVAIVLRNVCDGGDDDHHKRFNTLEFNQCLPHDRWLLALGSQPDPSMRFWS